MIVLLKSLPYFRDLKTFMLYFLILPILQACLFVFIIQDYTDGTAKNIMTASIILSSASMSLEMISGLFVADINRKIDRLVAIESPYSFYYWGNRFAVSFLGSYLLAIINGLLFALFNLVRLEHILWVSPICIVMGFIIGLCASFLSWKYRNVYFWSNIFGRCIVLFGGALGSVSQYPQSIKVLTDIFPFGKLLEVVHGYSVDITGVLFISMTWLIVTLLIYQYRIKHIANHSSRGMF